MTTNVTENSKIGDIRLDVSVSGLVVTVAAGSFKCAQRMAMIDYTLPEEYTYEPQVDPDEDITGLGYLAVREADDVVVLVTDEVSESDSSLFNWRGSGYRLLHALFTIHVPAAAAVLDEANLSVVHYHAPPEE